MTNHTVITTTWKVDQQRLSKIRETVFIQEQSVPIEMEWDEWDAKAWHLLALDHNDQPLGTARICTNGQIGRMAVLQQYRRQGIGSALLKQAIKLAKAEQLNPIFIHAQTSVEAFYAHFDFTVTGKEFIEAGISHIEMHLTDKNR